MRNVYIISGPAGVGKSTTSDVLVRTLESSAYISGDSISHMHINGREKPWESEQELSLIWQNILSLTRNFVSNHIDVVIDYVTFPNEANWLKQKLNDLGVNVVYVVLWTDDKTLIARDKCRFPEHQMGERCLILVEQFLSCGLRKEQFLVTTQKSTDDLPHIINDIMNNPQYRI